MACSCGKGSGQPAETYVVRRNDGRTSETTSKVEADILVTRYGGTVEVKKK